MLGLIFNMLILVKSRAEFRRQTVKENKEAMIRPINRDSVSLLIADDHPVVRQGLREMLTLSEMRIVAEAESGTEMIELARKLDGTWRGGHA